MAVIFSSDLVVAAESGIVQPLTHARIGYHNIVTEDNVIGSTEAAGFDASFAGRPDTYSEWRPVELPATITVDAGRIVEADYVAIGAHNLENIEVEISHSLDGVTYTVESTTLTESNDALMFLFEKTEVRFVRVRLLVINEESLILDFENQVYEVGDFDQTGGAFIGVLYIGETLEMQRPIYQGHSPATLSRQTELRPSRTEGGQWLGRTRIRDGYGTNFDWSNLRAAWYRENFDPFVEHARSLPFFIAWRPETYPKEVIYAQSDSDISPTNSGPRDLMSVSMTVRGYSNG